MLGQHYIGILSSQCCQNMCETSLEKKNLFAMLTQSALTVCRKTGYTGCPKKALHNFKPV